MERFVVLDDAKPPLRFRGVVWCDHTSSKDNRAPEMWSGDPRIHRKYTLYFRLLRDEWVLSISTYVAGQKPQHTYWRCTTHADIALHLHEYAWAEYFPPDLRYFVRMIPDSTLRAYVRNHTDVFS